MVHSSFTQVELNAAGSAGQDVEDAFALERTQMFLGRVGGLETEFVGDFGAGGRKAGALHEVLNEGKDLCLAGGQGAHVGSPERRAPRTAPIQIARISLVAVNESAGTAVDRNTVKLYSAHPYSEFYPVL